MKYVVVFIVVLFSLLFGGLGFYLGRSLGAIIEYALGLDFDFIQYLFAIPASVAFAILGGTLVIIYNETTDFLAQKFAEFIVYSKHEN